MECSPSPMQRLGIVLLLSGWIAAMLYTISTPPTMIRVVGWLGLIFGILALPPAWELISRKTPTVSVTVEGVLDVRFRVGRIPWDAISSISVVMPSNRPIIQLWLRDENAYLARSTVWLWIFAPIARALGSSPFSVSVTFLTPGFKPLYEYMLKFTRPRYDA
jgi:xanthosine utilization system XapX-like protein